MRGSEEIKKMIDLLVLELKKKGWGKRKKSGPVQLPEGAFVWHGHNMNAFFHIKTQEEEIHSPLL